MIFGFGAGGGIDSHHAVAAGAGHKQVAGRPQGQAVDVPEGRLRIDHRKRAVGEIQPLDRAAVFADVEVAVRRHRQVRGHLEAAQLALVTGDGIDPVNAVVAVVDDEDVPGLNRDAGRGSAGAAARQATSAQPRTRSQRCRMRNDFIIPARTG